VPLDFETLATVPGYPSTIRYFPTDAAHVAEFEKDYLDSVDAETEHRFYVNEAGELPPSTNLAISGGARTARSARVS
jgi:hypothetical protein